MNNWHETRQGEIGLAEERINAVMLWNCSRPIMPGTRYEDALPRIAEAMQDIHARFGKLRDISSHRSSMIVALEQRNQELEAENERLRDAARR